MVPDDGELPNSSSIPSHPAPSSPPPGRSCRGVLYYTSQMRANTRNPMCFGFSRTEERLRHYTSGDGEHDAAKEGRALLDFKYACVGYSAHQNATASNPRKQTEGQPELPFCMGLELLAERRASQATTATRQEHVNRNGGHRNSEGAPVTPRPPSSLRPPSPIGSFSPEEFGSRFIRNAGLIAAALGNNVSRLARYVKSGINDMLYPDRRRPK